MFLVITGTLYDVIFVQLAGKQPENQSQKDTGNHSQSNKYNINGNGHQLPLYKNGDVTKAFTNVGYVIGEAETKLTYDTENVPAKDDAVRTDDNSNTDEHAAENNDTSIEKKRGG